MMTSVDRVRPSPTPHRWGMVVAAVLLAAATTASAPAGAPAEPPARPGEPVLVRVELAGAPVTALVVPNRPGRNLVQLGTAADPAAGGPAGLSVGTAPDRLAPATDRPGTSGAWAVVDLPEGTSRLWIGRTGQVASFTVDAGPAASAAPDLTGPDGPECASVALARLAADRPGPLPACPAQALPPPDNSALVATVRFLAGRGNRTVTVVADGSARSRAAVDVVTAAARRAGMRVGTAGPVLVVAGWAAADQVLRDIAGGRRSAPAGAYLAPWLLHPPLLGQPIGQLLALAYSPLDPLAQQYVATLGTVFPGSAPSGSGYTAWLAAHGGQVHGPVMLYAAAHLTVPGTFPGHRHRTGWLSGGTVTAVAGPLNGG